VALSCVESVRYYLLLMSQGHVKGEVLSAAHKAAVYRNSWDCFRRIVREEGAKGLFHGLSANLVRSVAGAFLLVGYDECKKAFKLL
jgi:hypothetical protein